MRQQDSLAGHLELLAHSACTPALTTSHIFPTNFVCCPMGLLVFHLSLPPTQTARQGVVQGPHAQGSGDLGVFEVTDMRSWGWPSLDGLSQ